MKIFIVVRRKRLKVIKDHSLPQHRKALDQSVTLHRSRTSRQDHPLPPQHRKASAEYLTSVIITDPATPRHDTLALPHTQRCGESPYAVALSRSHVSNIIDETLTRGSPWLDRYTDAQS